MLYYLYNISLSKILFFNPHSITETEESEMVLKSIMIRLFHTVIAHKCRNKYEKARTRSMKIGDQSIHHFELVSWRNVEIRFTSIRSIR